MRPQCDFRRSGAAGGALPGPHESALRSRLENERDRQPARPGLCEQIDKISVPSFLQKLSRIHQPESNFHYDRKPPVSCLVATLLTGLGKRTEITSILSGDLRSVPLPKPRGAYQKNSAQLRNICTPTEARGSYNLNTRFVRPVVWGFRTSSASRRIPLALSWEERVMRSSLVKARPVVIRQSGPATSRSPHHSNTESFPSHSAWKAVLRV